jgi:hypothetical protein
MDVDDEEVMLEEVLQDLKGSLVSNVNQTLLILGKARRCTCHCGHATVDQRSVGGHMGDWNTSQMTSYH